MQQACLWIPTLSPTVPVPELLTQLPALHQAHPDHIPGKKTFTNQDVLITGTAVSSNSCPHIWCCATHSR